MSDYMHRLESLKDTDSMLSTWIMSASVMHIAHHTAAARFARAHFWTGTIAVALNAIVAGSLAASVLQEGSGHRFYVVIAILAALNAVLLAVNEFMGLSARSVGHHAGAVAFQGLRREMEEALVAFRNSGEAGSYEGIRSRWSEALAVGPPVPPSIHEMVKTEVAEREDEFPVGGPFAGAN